MLEHSTAFVLQEIDLLTFLVPWSSFLLCCPTSAPHYGFYFGLKNRSKIHSNSVHISCCTSLLRQVCTSVLLCHPHPQYRTEMLGACLWTAVGTWPGSFQSSFCTVEGFAHWTCFLHLAQSCCVLLHMVVSHIKCYQDSPCPGCLCGVFRLLIITKIIKCSNQHSSCSHSGCLEGGLFVTTLSITLRNCWVDSWDKAWFPSPLRPVGGKHGIHVMCSSDLRLFFHPLQWKPVLDFNLEQCFSTTRSKSCSGGLCLWWH